MSTTKIVTFILFGATLLSCISPQYPSKDDMDTFLRDFNKTERGEKINMLKSFLLQLKNPKSKHDDGNLEYFVENLARIYSDTADDTILLAIDETDFDGGFANYMCGFYDRIRNTQSFIYHYNNGISIKALERCIGINFTDSDIELLLKPNEVRQSDSGSGWETGTNKV